MMFSTTQQENSKEMDKMELIPSFSVDHTKIVPGIFISRQDELDEKTTLLARTYCLGTVCLSCEWILGKYRVTKDELAAIYESALPQALMELVIKEK